MGLKRITTKEGEIYFVDSITNKRVQNENDVNNIFCDKCIKETLPQSTGNLWSINFVGTTIKEIGEYCSICGSVVVEKHFVLFGIPIHSYGFYRVKRIRIPKLLIDDNSKFFARKLKIQKRLNK
ncbi:MAG: hypothetical protein ACYC6D_12890 [Melioribacteraceae bacterium]